MNMRSYYAGVLGVSAQAGAAEIKAAYRRLAKQYHPDLNREPGARERFLEIRKAYDFLLKTPSAFTQHSQTVDPNRADEQKSMREKRRRAAERIKKKREEEEAAAWQEFKKSGMMWVLVFFVLTLYFVLMGICLINISDYPYADNPVQNPELGLLGSGVMMLAFSYFLYRFWVFIRS
jgi:hypothetical protein